MQRSTVILGRLGAPHGVRGWLKVNSYTSPITNILEYPIWIIKNGNELKPLKVLNTKPNGKMLIVQLEGITDRNQASLFTNNEIHIERHKLPETEPDEYYWHDLIGLTVSSTDGIDFGKIIEMRETGANDVMIIQSSNKQRCLVPFLKHVIKQVDTTNKTMLVEWDNDF